MAEAAGDRVEVDARGEQLGDGEVPGLLQGAGDPDAVGVAASTGASWCRGSTGLPGGVRGIFERGPGHHKGDSGHPGAAAVPALFSASVRPALSTVVISSFGERGDGARGAALG